uniref:DUF4055 domain-containing protein n=1 Tax=viral metagenome TaxID=1070528 RepID=A0A6H1ZEC5_9ZZZZ
MNGIKDLVESPHSIFSNNCNYWNFLLESYEGGPDYCKGEIPGKATMMNNFRNWVLKLDGVTQRSSVNSNLFRHPKEREEDYQERLRMSYYYNFCSPIIDIYTDHLFKQPITENFGSIENDVEERSENIDNKGGSINEFRKEMADLAQVYGHIFVITDSPLFNGQINTKADIIDNNLFPYFSLHHPQNIINWALDEFGRPYWVLVRENLDGNKDPFNFDKNNLNVVQYRLWTREDWTLFNSEYQAIGTGSHKIGRVPITCVFDKQSKKVRNFLGISSIADISFIARDVYNSCSELKQILRDQTFAFLVLFGNSSEYDELSVGTSKGLLVPPDRTAPFYLSPPSSNAETYYTHIDRQVTKMFQLAKLEGGSVQAPDTVQQSGVSKAWDFNQTNSALSKKAGNLEDGETKLWDMFSRWVNGNEFDGSIDYPHEFNINSLKQDMDEAETAMRLQLGSEFNKEVKKAIIQKKFPRMNKEELDEMISGMETQEDRNGKGESGRLLDRIPSLQKSR